MESITGIRPGYLFATGLCFAFLWMYWMVMATRTKTDTYKQTSLSRIIYLIVLGTAFTLIYYRPVVPEFLRISLFPQSDTTGIAGVVLCGAGIAFAIWARRTLGSNWSGEITIKRDHELVRGGPYGFVRHPIYTGILTAMLGAAVVTGELRGLVALMLCFSGFIQKIMFEEKLMMAQFPDDYPLYKKQVKMLIPFLF